MNPRAVGFIGVGAMGGRMAPHVAGAGFPVHVHDLDEAAARNLAAAHDGIVAAPSAKAVAAACNPVIAMLPGGADVRRAALGDDGLAAGFGEGGVLIDMGSSEPWLTTALAAELAARGIGLIDAPVSGGVEGADAGTLTVMVGGADDLVEACLPVIEPMAGHIFRTGRVGSGHALKTLNNLLSGLNTLAAAEALLIGKRFGLDPAVMVEVFNRSTGMSSVTRRLIKQQVLSRRFADGFGFDLRFKDLGIAMELAQRTATPVPLSGLGYQLYRAARSHIGPGRRSIEVVRWLEHMAKTELTPGD